MTCPHTTSNYCHDCYLIAKTEQELYAFEMMCLGIKVKQAFVCQHGTGSMTCDCCAKYYANELRANKEEEK
jgi:hypothetical protein